MGRMDIVFDHAVDQGLIGRALAPAAFGSMWLDIPRPDYPSLPGAITCDLLVVGGGYTGLWTALHAAERDPGATIVLIEAERIGWAASGRNGGFVEASLTHGAANGKSRWPAEFDQLQRLGLDNLNGMQADTEKYGMNVDWQRTGMLNVATEAHQVPWLREAAAAGEGRFLDQGQVRSEVDSPTYLAGLFAAETCAIVDPARLVFELARACTEKGVRIHEHTDARAITTEAGGVAVTTAAATITAQRVVLATNVFPSLLRRNRLHTVPVYDHVLGTEPLTSEQLGRIGWRSRQGIGDSGNQFHYYRLSAETGSSGAAMTRCITGDAASIHAMRIARTRSARSPRISSSPSRSLTMSGSATVGPDRSTPAPGSVRTGAWPAAGGSRTSTDSPDWAWGHPGSPPTSVWICWRGAGPSAPNWRWSASGRCRSRPSRWPASVSGSPGDLWIAPTTTAVGATWCWLSQPTAGQTDPCRCSFGPVRHAA
jgi:glycine/D-amino acid oxidase-like deaminating enzyme